MAFLKIAAVGITLLLLVPILAIFIELSSIASQALIAQISMHSTAQAAHTGPIQTNPTLRAADSTDPTFQTSDYALQSPTDTANTDQVPTQATQADPTTDSANPWQSIQSNLSHFFDYLFLKFVKDTFIVSFFVLLCTSILGVSTAYLIANFRFYGSGIFEKMLILPLAIPAYILAFVYVGIMDFGGFFHSLFGFSVDFFNIFGVVFVLSISLYPYVYLFAKTAFATEAKELFEVAKICSYSEWKFFRKFALLIARPAILAALMLVLMETLSDYGASA